MQLQDFSLCPHSPVPALHTLPVAHKAPGFTQAAPSSVAGRPPPRPESVAAPHSRAGDHRCPQSHSVLRAGILLTQKPPRTSTGAAPQDPLLEATMGESTLV